MKNRITCAVLSCLGAIALTPATAFAAQWTSFAIGKLTGYTTTFAHTPDGRFVLGTNSSVFVQNTFGAAAKSTIPSGGVTYDPSFVAIKDATTALLGAGGFGGPSGVHLFNPSTPTTAVTSTALTSLQNYTAAYWKHPTSGREGWLIGGGNGVSGAHNVTFVSLDGSKVGAITEALCTYSSGITVDGAGNLFTALYELDNAPNAADAEEVLKFTVDQVDAAVAAVIAGTPAPVARSASQFVFKFDSAASIAVDSLDRIWAAGFKTSALQCYDPATGLTKRFTPDHPKIAGAAGPTSYQVQCFRSNSTNYVAFIANDLFTTANTDIMYGYKPVNELLPAVQITSVSQTVGESAGSVTISARVNIAPTTKLTVPVTFSGTATKGSDFNSASSFVFNAGETTKSITVTVIDDLIDEPIDSETVVLRLGKPSLSTYSLPANGSDQVTITITDNDLKPAFSVQTLGRGRVGSAYAQTIAMTANALPVRFTAHGLPKGMSIDPNTGALLGTPTELGEFDEVWITATNSAGTSTSVGYVLVVDDFAALAHGSFVGLTNRTGTTADGLGARVDIAVSDTAAFTGKVTIGAASSPISSVLDTSGPNPTGTANFKRGSTSHTLTFAINATNGSLSGTLSGGETLAGWRAAGATTVTGVHNFFAAVPGGGPASAPEGASYGSATITAAGSVTVSGRTADGSVFSTSGPLGAGGEALVYQALYAVQGTFAGTLAIANDAPHTLSGSLSWSKPAQSSGATYRGGWSPVLGLTAKGGKYRPVSGSTIAMNVSASASSNARIFLQDGGIEVVATNPTTVPFGVSAPAVIRIASPNALSITNSSGAFSGSVRLGAKTVSVQGLIVPETSTSDPFDGAGHGYFLLPTATSGVTRSGLVVVEASP